MLNLHAPCSVQPLGQQRAMAGGRLALDAHQGDDGRAGRQVVEQGLRIETGQHVALVGFDKRRAEFGSLARGDPAGFVGRGLACSRRVCGRSK